VPAFWRRRQNASRRQQPRSKVHEQLAEKFAQALEFPCSIPVSQHWFAVLFNEEQRLMSEAKKGQFLTLDPTTGAGIDTSPMQQTGSRPSFPGASLTPCQRLQAKRAALDRAPPECRPSARRGQTSRVRRLPQAFSRRRLDSPAPSSAIRLPDCPASLSASSAACDLSQTLD